LVLLPDAEEVGSHPPDDKDVCSLYVTADYVDSNKQLF